MEYVLFNPKIKALSTKNVSDLIQVRRVGITTGGSDPKNVLLALYDLIDFEVWEEIQFIFFVGNNYMHKAKLPSHFPENVQFMPYDVTKIMKSQLVVSTFGVSTYELLALGMPIISLGHQEANSIASKVLSKHTTSFTHLGVIDDIAKHDLHTALEHLILSYHLRIRYHNKAKSLMDFKAEERIRSILEA
ncbi:hypothetical protein [Croceiramulus getboli]|nr:hypothetical protein P8624_13330 [Flavobacteriaceae bacterium YJPT1-3]